MSCVDTTSARSPSSSREYMLPVGFDGEHSSSFVVRGVIVVREAGGRK